MVELKKKKQNKTSNYGKPAIMGGWGGLTLLLELAAMKESPDSEGILV